MLIEDYQENYQYTDFDGVFNPDYKEPEEKEIKNDSI